MTLIQNSKLKTQNSSPLVLKVGGNDIDNPDFLDALAAFVASLTVPVVIVHGGGKEIGTLQARMGITPQWVDGLRVTDDETLAVVEMVLRGRVNNRVVRRLVAAGVEAEGISGTDRGLLRAVKLHNPAGDLGRVGKVTHVRGEVLREKLAVGITPVIAPLALSDEDGEPYNINADHAAAAVAAAVGAGRIVFLTNVRAVLVNDTPQPALSEAQAEALIADGTIHSGMIPKVRTALHAVHLGIPQAVITDLDGLRSDTGTVFHAEAQAAPSVPAWMISAAQAAVAAAPR